MTNIEIIRKVNEAYGEGNPEKILLYLADDVICEMPGVETIMGKEEFAKKGLKDVKEIPAQITVRTEIAEGDMAAVEGRVLCENKGSAVFKGSFVNIYRFDNGKIKEMRFYAIADKNPDVSE